MLGKKKPSSIRQAVHNMVNRLPDNQLLYFLSVEGIMKERSTKSTKHIDKEIWLKHRLSIREIKKGEKLLTELPASYREKFVALLVKAENKEMDFPPIVVLPMMTVIILCTQTGKDPALDSARPAAVDTALRSVMSILDDFKLEL